MNKVTLGEQQYEYKDFKTLRMVSLATRYYSLYADANKAMFDKCKDASPLHEELVRMNVEISIAFNLFVAEATVAKRNPIRFWRKDFKRINYLDCTKEEVEAFVAGFFAGLSASQPTQKE